MWIYMEQVSRKELRVDSSSTSTLLKVMQVSRKELRAVIRLDYQGGIPYTKYPGRN